MEGGWGWMGTVTRCLAPDDAADSRCTARRGTESVSGGSLAVGEIHSYMYRTRSFSGLQGSGSAKSTDLERWYRHPCMYTRRPAYP